MAAPKLLHRAGVEERAEWSFRRRAGPFFKNQCGTGNALGSLDALQQMRSLLLVCKRPGCFGLVDYKAARRQALQAGRVDFRAGDGCAGARCSADYRAARFRRRQRQQAELLRMGERMLVRWPHDREDSDVWAWPAAGAAARSAAAAASAATRSNPRP